MKKYLVAIIITITISFGATNEAKAFWNVDIGNAIVDTALEVGENVLRDTIDAVSKQAAIAQVVIEKRD